MNKKNHAAWVLFSVSVCILSGCVSSEETGAGDRAISPVRVSGSIDTARYTALEGGQPDTAGGHAGSLPANQSAARKAPKFKSRQDTVKASVIRKSKRLKEKQSVSLQPKHPVFTVQIGAFGHASNALVTQKKAKERFSHQPVFNTYLKKTQLYRVSIGRYSDSTDAVALADTMRQNYFQEYNQCWITSVQ